MIIANSQLITLSIVSYSAFLDKMVEFVIENFEKTDQNGDLRNEISSFMAEAERYGFEDEVTIEQYVFLKWEYPEFKKYPLSSEILEILEYPEREPIIIIEELTLLFENQTNESLQRRMD